MRVHRPEPGEIFSPSELDAVKSSLGAVRAEVAAQCPDAAVVWATATTARAPAVLGLGHERCIALHVVFAISTSVRLGLHAWRATLEGERQEGDVRVIWIAHEVEKAVRNATRQSWFSLALLAGAPLMGAQGVWRELPEKLPTLVAADAVHTLVNLARGYAQTGCEGEALRLALASARLLRAGLLCLDAPGQFQDAADGSGLQQLIEEITGDLAACALPASPPGYDAVSRWLVSARLEQSPVS